MNKKWIHLDDGKPKPAHKVLVSITCYGIQGESEQGRTSYYVGALNDKGGWSVFGWKGAADGVECRLTHWCELPGKSFAHASGQIYDDPQEADEIPMADEDDIDFTTNVTCSESFLHIPKKADPLDTAISDYIALMEKSKETPGDYKESRILIDRKNPIFSVMDVKPDYSSLQFAINNQWAIRIRLVKTLQPMHMLIVDAAAAIDISLSTLSRFLNYETHVTTRIMTKILTWLKANEDPRSALVLPIKGEQVISPARGLECGIRKRIWQIVGEGGTTIYQVAKKIGISGSTLDAFLKRTSFTRDRVYRKIAAWEAKQK